MRYLSTSLWPSEAANQIGALPKLVSALGDAPDSTNNFTTSKKPARAAQCSGVQPFCNTSSSIQHLLLQKLELPVFDHASLFQLALLVAVYDIAINSISILSIKIVYFSSTELSGEHFLLYILIAISSQE
jgi:hypothetical protein